MILLVIYLRKEVKIKSLFLLIFYGFISYHSLENYGIYFYLLPKGKFGLTLNDKYLFAHFEEIYSQCFTQPPAIIYGWGGGAKKIKLVGKYGYKIVYAHSGLLLTGGCWTRQKVWAGQYLAVREDLLNLVGELEMNFYKWPNVGCQR